MHIGLDAETGQIVAASLTAKEVGALLDQVAGAMASFTADGGYDQDSVSPAITERNPETAIIVPPCGTAVPSATAEIAPTQRDRHLQCIAEHGRMAWQRASGYTRRALVEVAVHTLNRMLELGRPNYVRTA